MAVQRQLRALDVVADESGSARAAFFAASRHAMYVLGTGDDLSSADLFIVRTAEIGSELAEPDVFAVVHELRAMHGRRMVGDPAALKDEATAVETFGSAEGTHQSPLCGSCPLACCPRPRGPALTSTQLTTPGVATPISPAMSITCSTMSCVVGVAAARRTGRRRPRGCSRGRA